MIVGGLVVSTLIAVQITGETQERMAIALAFATQQSALLHDTIDGEMQAEMEVANGFAERLSSGELSYPQAVDAIALAFDEKPGLQGIAIAFEPYCYSTTVKLYAPYYIKNGAGQITRIQVENSYDYTDASIDSAQWYYKAIDGQAGVWRGAYYGKAADDLLIVYSVPFQSPQNRNQNVGVVVVAHSATATFKHIVQGTDLGQAGYAFLVNADQKIAYHPEAEMIGLDAKEAAGYLGGGRLLESLAKVTGSEEDAISFSGEMGQEGERGWFFVHPLSVPGWRLVVAINERLSTYDAAGAIRPKINLGLAVMICLTGVLMRLLSIERVTPTRLMGFSVGLGVLFAAEILWIWHLIYTNPELNHQKVIINDTDLQRLLEPMADRLQSINAGSPVRIPTGIVVENLTLGTQTVKLAGYLWQRYPAGTPEEMIDFPQLTDQIGGLSRRETYRVQKNGMTVVGWFFSTEIQQAFDVSHYPLDQTFVHIQIEPSKFSDTYVLVPDIQEYAHLGPGYKPGLSEELWVRGWHVTNSYFSYDYDAYGTQFGIYQKIQKDTIPILNFNIRLTRDIISPVIAYCIVLYVIIIQVYGLAILNIDNAFQVLSIAAALFLASAISHNTLRDSVGATGVVYLEYFFILLYVTILFTTINAVTRVLAIKLILVSYQENLLIKVLFWPTYLGLGLLITLFTFYP